MHTYSQSSLLQRYTTQKMFCLDTDHQGGSPGLGFGFMNPYESIWIHEPISWVNTVKAKVEKDYITLISIHTELTGDLTTFILMLGLRVCTLRTSFANIFFAQSHVPLYMGGSPGLGFG